jgi:hypothetical protein
MNFQTSHAGMTVGRERVSGLLSRYPKLSEQEVREILHFLRTGRHLDVGLLTSDEAIRPKLDAFMEEHKSHFRLGFGEGTLVTGAIVALIVLLWIAWELIG